MFENMHDLDKVKKRMQKRNEELNDEEKQLKNEETTLKKTLISLQNLREEIRSGVTQQRLKEIVYELKMTVRVKFPFFTLAKYFVLQNVDRQLHDVRDLLHQIPDKIKRIERDRESVNKCPACGGFGSQVQRRYMREDGVVSSVMKSSECPLCKGKGRIDLNGFV